MVYGGAVFERIVLTRARCWRGAHAPELPDVSACMPEMQRAILSGRMPEGDRMLEDALKAAGYRPAVAAPVPVCELRVTAPARRGFRRYRRVLDMENACAISFSVRSCGNSLQCAIRTAARPIATSAI